MSRSTSNALEAAVVLRYPDLVGEAPTYDAANSRLVWIDLGGERVRELRCTGDSTWEEGRTWELGRIASAVVPRTNGGLLVTSGSDFVVVSDDDGAEAFASLDLEDRSGARFNDAKCDPQGRLVAGWLGGDPPLARPGKVVRLDPDGSIETILTLGVGCVPNGLDWSPDGGTFYLVDTAASCVYSFDYDSRSGTVSNRRTAVTVERGAGALDGMDVDSEGRLWIAVPYAGEIRCYDTEGTLVEKVNTLTRTPTSCAFAGPDGSQLFITSFSVKLARSVPQMLGVTSDRIEAAERDEIGGALLVCQPGVSGPPATSFAG